ncbi:tRNA (uracil-5-)-methyltransferase [Clostridiales bacterium PH28_bin88]|nr:tRNA (uracil-5-)-methyltransferase [Clostridiales bacterium PH28_bin88]
MPRRVLVVGGGLAGAEAGWQLAKRGVPVEIREMRPHKLTPAHHSGYLAELVCSNSFRANNLENAVGLLKEEMRRLDSLVMRCADAHRIPAGGALAVDREGFAKMVTETLEQHPLVRLVREEVSDISLEDVTILATGPLTSSRLAASIRQFSGEDYLYFYDAAAPIVTAESVDYEKAFRASRYGKGDADYINCPMTEEEYHRFYEALVGAETHPLHCFEREVYFEGCMPVEAMAARGRQTLLFGPLKPVGLLDPKTGRQPFAVVQLRQDNREGTLLNMVGFQTHLKWGEQEQVFRMIPGLEKAEFIRFGVMHRNTYINSPRILRPTMQTIKEKRLFFAGQITGVEGYVESASNGLVAGINAARSVTGQDPVVFPTTTAHGALCHYITSAVPDTFQPMNVTFGLMPPLETKVKGRRARNEKLAARALQELENFIRVNQIVS